MPSVSGLFIYPVKSCGGIALERAELTAHGFQWDRHWMVVDQDGRFVSQREYPSMALIAPRITSDALVLSVSTKPDVALLHIPLELSCMSARVHVSVWKDSFEACDEGDAAASWFSALLGAPVRLVRFDRDVTRLASRTWTGDVEAPTQFADGFPLLVTTEASLDELNGRLMAKGVDAIPMNRFRPNIVLEGLDAFDEDFTDTIAIGADEEILLRLVKPCARCPITTVDQQEGRSDPRWPNEPLDTMAAYRANPRVDGGLTFGQNAIVIEGAGRTVHIGAVALQTLHFPDF